MPPNFYERVLELEHQIEKQKEKVEEKLLREIMDLYSQAIEYFGYVDQPQRCTDLQKRMQSILVRDYILDSLSRYDQERKAKEEADTRRRNSKLTTPAVAEKAKPNI